MMYTVQQLLTLRVPHLHFLIQFSAITEVLKNVREKQVVKVTRTTENRTHENKNY